MNVAKVDPTGTKVIYLTGLNGTYGATPAASGSIRAAMRSSPAPPTRPISLSPTPQEGEGHQRRFSILRRAEQYGRIWLAAAGHGDSWRSSTQRGVGTGVVDLLRRLDHRCHHRDELSMRQAAFPSLAASAPATALDCPKQRLIGCRVLRRRKNCRSPRAPAPDGTTAPLPQFFYGEHPRITPMALLLTCS